MKFRQFTLESGTVVLLGKDAESNDELIKKFKGKENIIIHTVMPGSPFCVIDNANPSIKDISISGTYCAKFSQDWRDNKKDVKISIFTGKDVKKDKKMEAGTWAVKKSKIKIIKKEDIQKVEASLKI
jgi:predicted ribosome quality control (RQC) complex YloA/Tae2 family protein